MKKRVLILGSTGSIGVSTLRVIESLKGSHGVAGLAIRSKVDLLIRQAKKFKPGMVAVADPSAAVLAARKLKKLGIKVLGGPHAVEDMAAWASCDVVLAGIVGAAGLPATYQAVRRGKQVGLANKEALVVAGDLMTREAAKSGAVLLAVDSEHAAIAQCLQGSRHRGEIRRILLTASGGPFLRWPAAKIPGASVAQALRHPTWKMGAKITIDSATLMNKGLEVIEARYLFGLSPDKISVVIHPQSVVHSMVEFQDGTILAQLGSTDMRVPIQYALTYPRREAGDLPRYDPSQGVDLRFEAVPPGKFPCLALAYRALRHGGFAPGVLSASNEVAVAAFLAGKIRFGDIARVVAGVLARHLKSGARRPANSLAEVLDVQVQTTRETESRIAALVSRSAR